MLRRHMQMVGIAVLALGMVALVGCNKKKSDKTGAGTGMGAAMDTEPPPGMPVEMAPDGMDAMNPVDPMVPDDMGADVEIPKKGQATARMILIGWKESAGPKETKRTKAEAKALAEKALAAAKAKPGNEKAFAALVKKYSDGPNVVVGPFNPTEGQPYIVKAVFPLKVGGVSGILERKAGFYIFMRTK